MNSLNGKISLIKTHGNISQVKVDLGEVCFCTVIIETPETASYLKIGNPIQVVFKETEVIIGKGKQEDNSIQNKVEGVVLDFEKGVILSKVIIKTAIGKISSFLTTDSAEKLQLEKGTPVCAMIQTTEIMLSE